jgi:hypothetical protein
MTDATLALPERRKPIPKRVRAAIELLAKRRATITAAAAKVGISREYLSRSLGEPHVADYLRRKAARTVAVGALRAATREIELIDARSEHVSHDASKHVLACAGIKPAAEANVNLNVEVRAGWVIDLSGRNEQPRPGDIIVSSADPPMKVVSPAPATPALPAAPAVISQRGQG